MCPSQRRYIFGPNPTFRFVEWRHIWMFSGLWVLTADVWFMFCSSLCKELVHICAVKYFWLDLMREKWLRNNGNYWKYLHFMESWGILQILNGNSRWPWLRFLQHSCFSWNRKSSAISAVSCYKLRVKYVNKILKICSFRYVVRNSKTGQSNCCDTV